MSCNDEYKQLASKQIVMIARGILSGELGLIAGAREINRWRFDVGAEHDSDLLFFVALDSETDRLPIGEHRRHWNAAALKAKDEEVAECEAYYRSRALEACKKLIQKYGNQVG